MMYLAEKTGKFMPRDMADRYRVVQWLMFQMGGVGPMFGQYSHFTTYAPETIEYSAERYTKERMRLYVEAEKLIHEEAPKVRSISAYNLSAWRKALKGYRPNLAGNMTYNAGGFRNAWLAKS